ncbi:GDSL-type esterase/lipase family protein [Sphingomonas bacterium]|uniref:GDSL-type esterase/lipase family protein n=1 Tax=Sphingomonas bacterium TaxID=1895847 RepID=UPI00157605D0|nr:GDSL-type esterase/lipase family protein [Sphingomonas bacterium]
MTLANQLISASVPGLRGPGLTGDDRTLVTTAAAQALGAALGNIAGAATAPGYVATDGTTGNIDTVWLHSPATLALGAGVTISYSNLFADPGMNVLSFYAQDGTFISGVSSATHGVVADTVTPPPNSASMHICYGTATAPIIRINPPATTLTPEDYAGNLAGLATTKGYIANDGTSANADVNWLNSPKLAVTTPRIVRFSLPSGAANMNPVSFYAADGSYLSGVPGSRLSGQVAVPDAATTMQLCKPKAGQSFFSYTAPAAKAPFLVPSDWVYMHGDSRSSTDYTFNADEMAAALGCNVHTGGFSGHTVAQNASDAELGAIFAFTPTPELITVLPGGNDSGAAGTVGTFSAASVNGIGGEAVVTPTDITADYAGTSFIQAVDHQMRKIQAHYRNVRARAGLTGSETEDQKNAKIDAVTLPLLVFFTDAPQQRSADASWGTPADLARKANAVREAAARNGVLVADSMALDWDMTLEVAFPGPASVGGATNKAINQGNFYMDGLHPNRFGWRRLALLLAGVLGMAS